MNPFEVSEIADKLVELLQDTEKATRFGQAGYDLVVREFSLDGGLREILQSKIIWRPYEAFKNHP